MKCINFTICKIFDRNSFQYKNKTKTLANSSFILNISEPTHILLYWIFIFFKALNCSLAGARTWTILSISSLLEIILSVVHISPNDLLVLTYILICSGRAALLSKCWKHGQERSWYYFLSNQIVCVCMCVCNWACAHAYIHAHRVVKHILTTYQTLLVCCLLILQFVLIHDEEL